MTSFQAKIGWERPRKREKKKKKIVPMGFYPTSNRKFQKYSKNQKTPHSFFSSENKLGKAKKERKQKKSFR